MSLLRRFRIPIIGGVVAILVVGFLLFRPDKLFVDDVVDESLDDAFAAAAADEASGVTETETESTTTTVPEDDEAPAPETTVPPTTAAVAEGPVVLATGDWYGIDHSASGGATIYEQDGERVLRFEDDTDIQNGPDLYVWLLAEDDYQGGNPTEYIDLGKIKGNVGGQNYPLPDEYDPDVHRAVLIWCLRFTTPFAAAPLT